MVVVIVSSLLVGRTGAAGVSVVVVTELVSLGVEAVTVAEEVLVTIMVVMEVELAPGERGQRRPVVQIRSVGQQPPPRLMGQARALEAQVRVVCGEVSVAVVVGAVDVMVVVKRVVVGVEETVKTLVMVTIMS